MALTRSCGRLTVATCLALLLRHKVDAVEPRLDAWCGAAPHHAGGQRHTLGVTTCLVPLGRWVVALWRGTPLALAREATALGGRFVVLTVRVVYRGCALPVAGTVLPATQPHAWRRAWRRRLRQGRPALPADWTVLVLADRGLWARWLFLRMVRLGWHPLLRLNQGATCRPAGQARWDWLRALGGRVGQRWRGREPALVAAARRLACTLVAWWDEGSPKAWCLLTDLQPEGCEAAWYGVRGWCEQGFTCVKRGGWQGHYPPMTAPDRAARLWLAVAVATVWMRRVGSALEGGPPPAGTEVPALRPLVGAMVAMPGRPRRLRLLRLGWVWCLVCQITTGGLPLPQPLVPEPWPAIPLGVRVVTFHQNTLEYNEI